MQKLIKRFIWVLLLACSWQNSFGFSYGGPIGNGGDDWQTSEIGYGLPGDLNAPKNIGEEYRRNIAVMYYTFDQNFLDYFGPEGANAVGSAYTVLNALTNLDNYTKSLNEIPVETRQQNYQAQALGLYDLKSFTLAAMMEQLGLADPVRYMWTLHDRFTIGPGSCPDNVFYYVVQRNFDGTSGGALNQLVYSPYVNNTLYTYQILWKCSGPDPLAIAAPFSVDPLADAASPVASFNIGWGDFYTGLTRDDVAGLRSLMSTNNVNWETPASGTVLVSTNTAVTELFPVSDSASGKLVNGVYYGTSSYGALVSFAKTNNPAALQAQYPTLQFTVVTNYFTNVWVTNIISYFTVLVGAPIGSPPQLVTTKSVSLEIQERFVYRFDNIITNIYKSTTTATLKTIKVGPASGAPIGSPSVTNVTTQTVTLNVPSGEFYILPPNSPCGVDIVATQLTFTKYTTNIVTTSVGSTNNISTATNGTANSSYTQILITPYTSHVYVIHPVICDGTPVTGLLRGIGRTRYVRADYDSLIGQFWRPVTNDYSMTMITNSKSITRHLRRVVTQPDFLFSAFDGTVDGPNGPINYVYFRNVNFDEANTLPNLAGPGTIQPSSTISFNKNGPVYLNWIADVMDGTPYFTQTPGNSPSLFYGVYFVWASFDGTTNTPVVFPNTISIENLQNQILVQVSPTSVPNGSVDFQYTPVTFTATGGAFTQPFTWSASGLPNGLTVDADGTLSGVPTQAGTFDFTLTLTDDSSKTVQWTYAITITP